MKLFDNIVNTIKNKVGKSSPQTQTEEAEITATGRVIADHPSNNITPLKLKTTLEDAENGDLRAQHELFTDNSCTAG